MISNIYLYFTTFQLHILDIRDKKRVLHIMLLLKKTPTQATFKPKNDPLKLLPENATAIEIHDDVY